MQISPVDRSPQWRTQGADLYSTGASGAVPVRPVNPVNAVESTDRLGEGATLRTPEKPSDDDTANRDWTEVAEVKLKEKVEDPPKEPISKLLLEFIQSMWRASAQAVEQAQDVSKNDQLESNKLMVRPDSVTYSEPKVKRTGSL